MDQFFEISIILLVAFLVSAVMRLLKQPLVVGYIFTGLLVGPYFLNVLHSVEIIELFSKLGITSLLFIVGLGLSPKILKELGLVSTVTGVGQVVFTSALGYFIAILLGFSAIESGYVAVALAFSSTIIILKLLSDKGDVGKLYGKIAIGFLLVQDLIATIILVSILGLSTVQNTSGTEVLIDLFVLLTKGLLLLVGLLIFSTKILSRLTNFVAKSQEFLFISSLAWGMTIAAIYYKVGLSIEIGALVAGVTLSMTPYAYEISSRLKPLRDFFITLFFILLGSQMVFTAWETLILPTILFSLFILIGNPLIVFILMNLLGYTKKTAFLAGLTVAQISEFSLILVKLGHDMGHVHENVLSMVTLVGIVTIAGSTYLIMYSDSLYKHFQKYLSYFEFRKSHVARKHHNKSYDALIFGYRRAGPEFAHVLHNNKLKFLVVDFNPDTIHELERLRVACEYGDISDVEFLQDLPLSSIKFVFSSVPDFDANILLCRTVRRANEAAVIIILADTPEHALDLYTAGATNVVLSHYIGAKQAADMIQSYGLDFKRYAKTKETHINYLQGVKNFSLRP